MIIQDSIYLVTRELRVERPSLTSTSQDADEELLLEVARAHTAKVVQASILMVIKDLQPKVTNVCQDSKEELLLEAALAHTAMVIQASADLVIKEQKLGRPTVTCEHYGVYEDLLIEAARAHTAKVIQASIIQVVKKKKFVTFALSRAHRKRNQGLLLETPQSHNATGIQASANLVVKDPQHDSPTQTSATEDSTLDDQLMDTARAVVEDIIKCSRELILQEIESAITDKLDQGEAKELSRVHLKTRAGSPTWKTLREPEELKLTNSEPLPLSQTTDQMSGLCCGVRKKRNDGGLINNKKKGMQGFLFKAQNLFTCSSRLPKEED